MSRLLFLLLFTLLSAGAPAQDPKLKPLHEILAPAETLPGLWVQTKPGNEYMTFHADGRLIMTRGQFEKMECRWKADTSVTPWRMDITIKGKEGDGTIFTVFDFPEKDQFRFAPPAIDAEKRPGLEVLQKSTLLLKRVPLEKHGGIYQAVEAHLRGLSGEWQGTTSGSKGVVTFTKDGHYTMTEGGETDKGRFRIDVSKVPCKIDLISSEGGGARYGLYELNGDTLKVSRAEYTAEKRPAAIEGAVQWFSRKK